MIIVILHISEFKPSYKGTKALRDVNVTFRNNATSKQTVKSFGKF